MPMKEQYYSVDGQIIGYENAVGRKDFLTDALGSVTGEVDQTGTNRTFNGRYKPYGGMLWATGTRGSFGWVGAWGYRSTGLKNSSHYVRARHYSQICGTWTAQDPLWPSQPSYRYCFGNPIHLIDPLGLWDIKVTNPTLSSGCGGALFRVTWINFQKSDNGWIIQHFVRTANVKDCAGKPILKPANENIEYWEAWQVVAGVVYAGKKNKKGDNLHDFDVFNSKTEGKSCGEINLTGQVTFFSKYDLQSPPWGEVEEAGGLPAMKTIPPNWFGSFQNHKMNVVYNCCKKPYTQTVKTVPYSTTKEYE